MRRFYLLALLVAVLIISSIFMRQRAFSQYDDDSFSVPTEEVQVSEEEVSTEEAQTSDEDVPTDDGLLNEEEVPTPLPGEEVPTPLPYEDSPIGEITVGGEPIPDAPEEPGIAEEPEEPIPPAPDLAPALAGETVLGVFDFAAGNLDGWTFTNIEDARLPIYPWEVLDGRLMASDNTDWLIDTVAVAPTRLSGNGAVEMSGFTGGAAAKLGLVFGYQDTRNYSALILGSPDLPDQQGLSLVQVVDGNYNVVSQDVDTPLEVNTWYQVRCAIDGTTINVNINGTPKMTATLPQPLAGEGVGLYASWQGFAFFDNLRILGK